jgi:hypothetical protein
MMFQRGMIMDFYMPVVSIVQIVFFLGHSTALCVNSESEDRHQKATAMVTR